MKVLVTWEQNNIGSVAVKALELAVKLIGSSKTNWALLQ